MSQLDDLKTAIKSHLGDLECVIGWEQGYDQLHATPLFIRTEADLDRLLLGPLAVHNLATYLTGYKGKKVGVVVKGCDSRSVIQLLNEKLINREEVVIFGLCCDGVVSQRKIRAALPADPGFVESVTVGGDDLKITVAGQAATLKLADVQADKCRICTTPDAIVSDVLIGAPHTPAPAASLACQDEFEAKSEAEKLVFWQETMSRCIRCYACRNACPMWRVYCANFLQSQFWLTMAMKAS